MTKTPTVDWCSYASVYDTMAEHNPAYQDLLNQFRNAIGNWSMAAGSVIADLGAGTGNFSLELARTFPQSKVIHLEPNSGMNAVASHKAGKQAVTNLEILETGIDRASFQPGSLSAISTIHALYTFPDPCAAIRQMFTWLRPGGCLFACDVGRMSGPLNWAVPVLSGMVRRLGCLGAARLGVRSFEIARQNRRILKSSRSGNYWSHSHTEFCAAIESAGFTLLSSQIVFRGESDLVLAIKPN